MTIYGYALVGGIALQLVACLMSGYAESIEGKDGQLRSQSFRDIVAHVTPWKFVSSRSKIASMKSGTRGVQEAPANSLRVIGLASCLALAGCAG